MARKTNSKNANSTILFNETKGFNALTEVKPYNALVMKRFEEFKVENLNTDFIVNSVFGSDVGDMQFIPRKIKMNTSDAVTILNKQFNVVSYIKSILVFGALYSCGSMDVKTSSDFESVNIQDKLLIAGFCDMLGASGPYSITSDTVKDAVDYLCLKIVSRYKLGLPKDVASTTSEKTETESKESEGETQGQEEKAVLHDEHVKDRLRHIASERARVEKEKLDLEQASKMADELKARKKEAFDVVLGNIESLEDGEIIGILSNCIGELGKRGKMSDVVQTRREYFLELLGMNEAKTVRKPRKPKAQETAA